MRVPELVSVDEVTLIFMPALIRRILEVDMMIGAKIVSVSLLKYVAAAVGEDDAVVGVPPVKQ
jgi:hypothetical protein